MNSSKNLKPQKASTARDQFIESVRRDLTFDQNGSKLDMNKSCGTIVAKVNRFNPAMDRMKGMTLIKKGEEDWLWEVEGDPTLIDRRLGGKAKRPRDKASDEEEEVDQDQPVEKSSQILHSLNNDPTSPKKNDDVPAPNNTIVRATRTPKRIRTSDPLGLATLPQQSGDDMQAGGPSRNTRSKAGGSLRGRGGRRASSSTLPGRKVSESGPKPKASTSGPKWKGKGKAIEDADQVAEITAGIDGFSVFSNHQVELQPTTGFVGLKPAVDASETLGTSAANWSRPVGHQVKVGMWLEETVQCPQAPVDAPKSQAPSSIAAIP